MSRGRRLASSGMRVPSGGAGRLVPGARRPGPDAPHERSAAGWVLRAGRCRRPEHLLTARRLGPARFECGVRRHRRPAARAGRYSRTGRGPSSPSRRPPEGRERRAAALSRRAGNRRVGGRSRPEAGAAGPTAPTAPTDEEAHGASCHRQDPAATASVTLGTLRDRTAPARRTGTGAGRLRRGCGSAVCRRRPPPRAGPRRCRGPSYGPDGPGTPAGARPGVRRSSRRC